MKHENGKGNKPVSCIYGKIKVVINNKQLNRNRKMRDTENGDEKRKFRLYKKLKKWFHFEKEYFKSKDCLIDRRNYWTRKGIVVLS
jgi:hypothetical protein